jgi:ribonuclease HII
MTRRNSITPRRIFPTLAFEQELWRGGFNLVAGIDEAGRGALAGPVAAAVVILPPDVSLLQKLAGVRDSKLMSPAQREHWAPIIRENALAWAVEFASAQEIDALGIVPATRLAARRALDALHSGKHAPDYLLTDYLLFREISLSQTALVKGDQLSLSVAAASVLAKTVRDDLMRRLDADYPSYGFARHKGYGTSFHRQVILRSGLSPIHRRSFSLHGP